MAFVSPLTPVDCESCGAELKVRWPTYLIAILPGSLIFLFGLFWLEDESLNQYLCFGVGFFIMITAQVLAMPFTVSPSEQTVKTDSD